MLVAAANGGGDASRGRASGCDGAITGGTHTAAELAGLARGRSNGGTSRQLGRLPRPYVVAGEKGVCLEDGYITQPGSRQGRWVFIRTVEVLCIRIKFVAQLSPSGVATR